GSRDVYLDGNAYFEVETDPRRPFRVHTAQGVVEVLGTRFGVRAYGADSMTAGVVAVGRVRVEQAPSGDAGDGRAEGSGADETDPRRTFRVHTAQGVVEVLGTRFGVRAYGADSMTTVVVAEGRVRLEQAPPGDAGDGREADRAAEERNAVVLEPGDLGRVTT